jgi:hypothetical protein
MERSAGSRETTRKKRTLFKKALIVPAEHGSWSWLLVPYFVGVLVAGDFNLPALLVLLGGLSGFFVRQPATAYIRARAGRGRKADQSLAAGWAIFFATIALVCLVGLLAVGLTELLWLCLPIVALLIFYLVAARQRRASLRTLWMEVAGAAGLAAMAPAAFIAATGELDPIAWILWGLMAGQNALGALYVRLRIADTHGRPAERRLVLSAHILVLAAVIAAAFTGVIPWLAAVPFAGFLARAIWAVVRVHPVSNIKRFGFTEIGVEIAGGLFIAAGWLI